MATSSRAEGQGKAKGTRRAPRPVDGIAAAPSVTDPPDRVRVAQRVLRARIRLALSHPFLATSVMRLPVREVVKVPWCRTAATDGYHLFYNPDWMGGLTDAELRGVLAHEVLHVLFSHSERRTEREPRPWNIACDFAINLLLIDQGFRLPEGGMISREFAGMTAEEIYALLATQARDAAKGKGASRGAPIRTGPAIRRP